MPRKQKNSPLEEIRSILAERRQYLKGAIDDLVAKPRLSRNRKLTLMMLAMEQADEAFSQADTTMELNEQLETICQGLKEKNAKLAAENDHLLVALMDGKSFHFETKNGLH